MRIERLQLDGFGRFAGQTLEFAPGLNVLFGANEAGKSTLLSFVRAMLFGFERRNHPRRYEPVTASAYGGEVWLQTRTGPLRVRRQVRGRAGKEELTLRGAMGEPLPPGRLTDALAGVSKDLFFEVYAFGLDELASFEKFARENSVSEALFAATMQGAQRLPEALEALRNESSQLYAPRAKRPLNEVLSELAAVQQELRTTEDRPAAYFAAKAELEQVERMLESLEAGQEGRRKELADLERWLEAIEPFERALALHSALAALPDLSGFPAGALERAEEAVRRKSALDAELLKHRAQLRALEGATQLLPPEVEEHTLEGWRAAVERFSLSQAHEARIDQQRIELDARWARWTATLEGCPLAWDAARLRDADLRPVARAPLAALRDEAAERKRALDARLDEGRRALEAERRTADAVQRVERELDGAALGAVVELQRSHRAAVHLGRLQAEWQAVCREQEALRASLGAVEARVEGVPPTPALLARWRWGAAAVLVVSALLAFGGWGATGWVAAGLLLLGFAGVLAVVAGGHRAQVDATARREQQRRAEVEHLERRVRRAEQQAAAAEEEARRAAAAAGLSWADPDGPSAQALEARLEALAAGLRSAEASALRERECLTLRGEAEAAARAAQEAEALRIEAQALHQHALEGLSALLARTGFPPQLSPEDAWSLWAEAQRLQEQLRELDAREEGWRQERARLSDQGRAVQQAAESAGVPPLLCATPALAAQALQERLRACHAGQAERRRIGEERAAVEELLRRVEHERSEVEQTLVQVLQQAGCGDLEAFRERALQARTFFGLRAEWDTASARLEAASGMDLAQLREKLRALGGQQGLRERATLQAAEVEQARQTAATLAEQKGRLQEQLAAWEREDGSGSLRRREEALRAEAQALTERYTLAKLATGLLTELRATFEREQQPRVIQRAGALFAEMTGGRYTHVFLPADGQRTLQLLDASGQVWRAEQLSRGTQEQLYLAFRVAVVEDFSVAKQALLPVVLDDILVNFDAARTRATLRTLLTLAKDHQVLALTCHPHLRALFEEAGAHLVELPARQPLTLLPLAGVG